MKHKAKTTNAIRAGSKHGWFWVKSNGRVQWKHKIFKHKLMYSVGRSVVYSNKSRSKSKASVAEWEGENAISSKRILKKLKTQSMRWTRKLTDCGRQKTQLWWWGFQLCGGCKKNSSGTSERSCRLFGFLINSWGGSAICVSPMSFCGKRKLMWESF